ncbi:MAG TPA: branched-chain amino acid ABC transporter permease [Rectinema sp.]|nr:MAG: High-affinity branched-chain amino acid transport system permease protein LivH [Spirochaetes bacterium ADurb.Bin001]HNT59385.1 branched-chain amino acid ABC transporter permease [Rectinema sp.]
MDYYISQLINGICQGSIYALMAIGYSVVVGVVGLVTFTHGEIIMVGAFASYFAFQLFGNNLLLGIIGSFAASAFIGIFVYKVCYEQFLDAPRHVSLLLTIGVSMLLKNLTQILIGPNYLPLLGVLPNRFFGTGLIGFNLVQIIVITTVVSLSLLLFLLFNRTRWGIMLRAVSQDKKAAAMVGINVKRTMLIGNCLGSGLGGIAGMLLAIYYQTLVATMGGSAGMKAFSASVLGGLTDIPSAALGGLTLGIIENLGITFTSASFRDIFAFIFLLLVLLFKPEGFARKRGIKT